MSLCERDIDCLECQSRGMCNSYAKFMYNKGIDEFYEKIREEELPIISHIRIEKIYKQLKEQNKI